MWEAASVLLCVVLQYLEVAVATQCWQGATFSQAVVSPAVRSSSILRIPNVASLAQCVGACCDLPGCDLAWLFERRCYVLSCQRGETCRPRERPGADSYLAFLQRGPPQTLVLQSLVRGDPYPGRWRPQSMSAKPPGDVEALKDLALFDEARRDFTDPGVMDLEYSEGDPEDQGGGTDVAGEGGTEAELFPNWPDVEGRDGFNQSESENGPEAGPTESSMAQNSVPTDGKVNQGLQHIEWSSTSSTTPAEERDTKVQNVSLAGSESTPLPSSPHKSTTDSSHPSCISTLLPTDAPPHPSSATPTATPSQSVQTLMVSLGDPVELTLPVDTVELEASIDPEPQTDASYKYEWHLACSTGGHKEAIEGEYSKSFRLTKLSPGHCVVTLAVSGPRARGEGSVNITVKEAPRLSQPPKAVVFPAAQVWSLPVGDVIINASQSQDDSVIVSCFWDQVSGPPVDLRGSTDRWILNMSDLAAGEYAFRLTVTDEDGLSDSTTASVRVIPPKVDHSDTPLPRTWTTTPDPATSSSIQQGDLTMTSPPPAPPSATATVKSGNRAIPIAEARASNHGPMAVVGPDRKLTLPVNSVTLDGSRSTDDQAIVSYHWDTSSGPPGLKMEGADKAVAMATGLRVGRYTFRLTVHDQEGEMDSVLLTVRVQEARNLPPVAHGSGSHTLTLPNNSLVLRGSVTDGDPAEVQYLWVRDNQSPAAGDVLYGSEAQAFLYLANLVEGTYLFQLRVTDAQGRTSTATATVEVCPDPGSREEVEVEMLVAVSQVSLAQRDTVLRQLAALLHVLDNDIHLRALQGHSHLSTVLRFSVRGPDGLVPGSKLASVLRSQLLREKTDYLLFRVLRVDTVLCLLHCSGHGQCDPVTKECVCDPFWTENLIRRVFGDGDSNCEWRVLYVILSSFMVIILILSFTWTFICCCKRRRRTKVRKKTKYTILDNMDEQERVELRPKYSIKHRSTEHNSSLMMSESELDSDQDTIFSRDRPVRSRNRAHALAARNGNAFG